MRLRLFLILFTLTIFSVASGLGLRYVLAATWVEPDASPPGHNVAAPINEGSNDQIKTGGLTIGGSFVVGAPTGGAREGAGSINAQKICINDNCLTSWAGGQSFVQNGNSFGALATLGTIDSFGLAFKTSDSEKMRLDINGNLGIGTISPEARLQIGDGTVSTSNQIVFGKYEAASELYTPVIQQKSVLTPPGSGNDLALGARSSSGGIVFYTGATANGTGALGGALGTNNNAIRMSITSAGNVGIGTTSPSNKLTVAGNTPHEYLWPLDGGNPELDFGNQAGNNHWGIYRANTDSTNDLRFWYGIPGSGSNNVTMTAAGDIDSLRCFGPVYVGQTTATYNGARGGYGSVNALCAASVSGSHVCTTSEILETIKCKLGHPSLPTAGQTWISNGPPGYTARANDCTGWTSSVGSGADISYGAIWAWDNNGGIGWVTTCNQSLKFACCK